MASGFLIRKNQYYDSVFLMRVNRRMSETIGVSQTAVLMGSPANKILLADIGISGEAIEAAQPNDLIVAAIADSPETVETVLGRLDEWLETSETTGKPTRQRRTLEEGLQVQPRANLAVITVPGEYAAREARKALEAGLHVFLFSDNVSIEEELDLKLFAARESLLVMGPDCGTSLIGGFGIGFANAVRRGSIGAIGAAGTGLQEFTSQVHQAGSGISHAIGTGSHDLSEKIGGLTTLSALAALEADPATQVIAIISKPPAASTMDRLLKRIEKCRKPVVGCFLGAAPQSLAAKANFRSAATIDEAVRLAVRADSGNLTRVDDPGYIEDLDSLDKEKKSWGPEQKYLRGILAGGTFCYQTQQILRESGIHVYSNSPLDSRYKLEHPDHSKEHSIVDMGDDFYMVGRPHPMIDGTMRKRRILEESQDPQMAILMLDFILGFNAAMDPVGELVEAIYVARRLARQRGGSLTVIASICGTEADPQDLDLQEKMLRETGARVYRSNARAAMACCHLLQKAQE